MRALRYWQAYWSQSPAISTSSVPPSCNRRCNIFVFGRHPPVWLVSALARLSCSTIISPRDCRTDERLIERRQAHGDMRGYTESAHRRGWKRRWQVGPGRLSGLSKCVPKKL